MASGRLRPPPKLRTPLTLAMAKGGWMTDNSAYDQWVDEAGQGKKRGWPILTTIIGAIVLLLISGNGSGEVGGGSTAYMMGRLIGGPLVLTVIVWGICYAVTYRHRGAGWQLGSFILFLMVSAVAVLFSIGSRGMALQEEADAVALTNERITQAAADGSIPADLPTDSGSPIQRMQAAFANDHFAEMRRFDAEVRESGAQQMLTMQGVSHSSAFLENCGRMAAAEQLALGFRGSITRHIAAARAVGERSVADGTLSRTDLEDMVQGMTQGDATQHDRIWTIQAESIRRSAAICRTLARRDWETSPTGQVLFRSEAAMNSVNGELSQLQRLNNELQGIMAAGRTRASAAADEVRNRQITP
jgi:hypothetical protein